MTFTGLLFGQMRASSVPRPDICISAYLHINLAVPYYVCVDITFSSDLFSSSPPELDVYHDPAWPMCIPATAGHVVTVHNPIRCVSYANRVVTTFKTNRGDILFARTGTAVLTASSRRPWASDTVCTRRTVLKDGTLTRAARRAQEDTSELLATIGELLVPLR